jgi:hypothetical protein
MDDKTKWLEWLEADPLTALTCYEASSLSWSEAWALHIKRFLPKSDHPLDLQEFDFQYNEEVAEYGVYGFRVCGDYWLVIDYFVDKVQLYKGNDSEYSVDGDHVLLHFDRPANVWPHQLVEICLDEIEPYMYNLLFPAVQTTEDEA